MVKFVTNALLLIVGLAFVGHAAAGGRGLPGALSPVILKVTVDSRDNTMVVSGQNFGSTPPTVRLAGQILDVQRFSENEVVASLPRDIQSATYLLTLSTGGHGRATSSPFIAVFFPPRAGGS